LFEVLIMARALVGLGSNLGDPRAQLDRALEMLRQTPQIAVERVSRWHETAPIGGPAGQQPFLNGAALLWTTLAPEPLHQVLIRIENELGRQRDVHWGARTIDLDLLLYDDLVLTTPDLVIPHPRFAFRKFAVGPGAEIAPDMRHPTLQWSLSELLEHLETAAPYVAITGAAGTGKTRLARALSEHFSGRLIVSPPRQQALAAGSESGRPWGAELELLKEPAARLPRPKRHPEGPLVVSDFWLGEVLAYGAVQEAFASPQAKEELRAAYSAVARTAASPKLVIILESASGAGQSGDHDRAAFQARLSDYAHRHVGLVLHLPAGDWETQWTEASAAVAAMS
jgi:2-amino-4-hydroxy-6-hydroxymethyldihydropteridine diphosphokinase